ncbi:hypothetical protein M0805_009903 [Coniferiporia weirii]|nr:hypothetical protein M0805_009903 [Coniferiporia weirii]
MTTSVYARSSANAKGSEEHRPKKRSKRADARAPPDTEASESLNGDRPPARIADSGKPGKVSKSCAECRRMKLKCNRVFPCHTCVKRGLEGICPEGSLVTGRGTRYVLAKTEKLHEKILLMADRIRDLEDAFRSLHLEHATCRVSSSSVTTHPLLRDDLLHIKGQLELYGISYPSSGLAMPARGGAGSNPNAYGKVNPTREDIHGTSLQAEYPESDIDDKLDCPYDDMSDDSTNRGAELDRRDGGSNDFTKWKQESVRKRGLQLRALLPSREEAEYFYDIMRINASWILGIELSSASCARHVRLMYDAPSSEVTASEVALFLMFLAVGASVDVGLDQGRPGLDTERAKASDTMKRTPNGTPTIPVMSRSPMDNYHLAKETICEVPVQSEPDVQAMKCLVYISSLYRTSAAELKDAGRQAIITISLAVRVAMKLGFQREETYRYMPPEGQQELRVIFWAILHAEARLNLGANRPSSTSLMQVTCKQRRYLAPSDNGAYRIEAICHNYRTAFLEECIIPVLEVSSSLIRCGTAAYDYLKVLVLDRQIRDFPTLRVPAQGYKSNSIAGTSPYSHSDDHDLGTSALTCEMLRAHALQEKHVILMQLHRSFWFAHVRDHCPLVQRHFFPSALATFNSACILVKSVHDIWLRAPELAARVSTFWYNAFSGAVSFFVLVMVKPFCPVTPLALQELDKTTQLFLEASSKCFMAARSYPILREFNAKVTEIYNRWKEQSANDVNIFGPNGEITICKSRIDVIVERLQRLPPNGMDKRDMIGEPNSVPPATRSQASEETKSSFWPGPQLQSCLPAQLGTASDETHVPEFYEMWQYVHQDLSDIVRRMPSVLKDALVDPRLATASLLLWGFIPSTPMPPGPTESTTLVGNNASMHIDVDPIFPSDLDWNTLTDALMDSTPSACQELSTPDSITTTPNSDGSEPEAHTFFPLLDTCSAFGRVDVDTLGADTTEAASGSYGFGSF